MRATLQNVSLKFGINITKKYISYFFAYLVWYRFNKSKIIPDNETITIGQEKILQHRRGAMSPAKAFVLISQKVPI